MADQTEVIRDRVRAAFESDTPLCIEGGGTKRFLGRAPGGRAPEGGRAPRGRQPCAERGSCSPCGRGRRWPIRRRRSPSTASGLHSTRPATRKASTIGGVVACALSGPARPWTGAVRDFVLGTRIVNGRGDVLSFGGEVMKNVAGYDVSRLMAGALGTLGVLLEVSFRLLPRPALGPDAGPRADRRRSDPAPDRMGAGAAPRSSAPATTANASTYGSPERRPPSRRPRSGSAASPGTGPCGRASATTATRSSRTQRMGRRSGGSPFPPTRPPSTFRAPCLSTGAAPSGGCEATHRARSCGRPRRRRAVMRPAFGEGTATSPSTRSPKGSTISMRASSARSTPAGS